MAFPYVLPTFNIFANVWRGTDPLTDPPDFVFAAQLYFNSRGLFDITPTVLAEWVPPLYLRVPLGSDLQVGDIVEAAVGDGWYYAVRWVDRVHRGFPNEYFVGVLEQTTVSPPPPVPSALLTEDGDELDTEAGDTIITE